MPLHPMFDVVLVSTSPDDVPIYKVEVAHTTGRKRYDDWAWTSVADAEAEIPRLQAEGKLPRDSELFD
jgi:hypothetical protein